MFGLLGDLASIALAPVRIVAAVVEPAARIITEPVAEVLTEVAKSVEETLK
jgi:hypothetical protein